MPVDPTDRCVWGRIRYEFQGVPDLHESARYAYVLMSAWHAFVSTTRH